MILRFLLALPIALGLAAGALYLFAPVSALDVLNMLTPGDRGVARVGTAIPFGPYPDTRLDIWAPRRAATGHRPVVIFFYGGGWINGRRQDYGFAAKAYAARGFVVVVPDYRKVPAVHFPAFVQDGAAAVRWVRDNIGRYGGDPDRLVLAGHSAGAYIAVMLALDRRYLMAVNVDPGIVRAVAGMAGPYDFYPFTDARARAAMGQAADPLATQPIHFARRDAPPLWLATGTADSEVRQHNAIALEQAEQQLGNRTTMLRAYPGVDHAGLLMALSKPFRSKAPVLDDSIAFFAAHGIVPEK